MITISITMVAAMPASGLYFIPCQIEQNSTKCIGRPTGKIHREKRHMLYTIHLNIIWVIINKKQLDEYVIKNVIKKGCQ